MLPPDVNYFYSITINQGILFIIMHYSSTNPNLSIRNKVSFLISHITPWILIQAYTHKQKENNGWSRVKTTKQSQHYKDYNGIHTQETMTKMKSKNANLLEQISSVLKPEVKYSQ